MSEKTTTTTTMDTTPQVVTNGKPALETKTTIYVDDMHVKTDEKTDSVTSPLEPPPLRYGWFSFTPNCLQCMNRAGIFLLFAFLSNTVQSMTINGLVGVAMSGVEKRFHLSSSQSSWISSAYEVSTMPMLVIVSYVAAQSHRPRWTAAGQCLLATGSILFMLPHFTTALYDPGVALNQTNMCEDRTNDTTPQRDTSASLQSYLAMFIIARLIQGVGATPLYTLAVTYMDDIVTKETFSMYIAIFYAGGVLGPAIGYIGGGYVQNLYTDYHSIDPIKELGLSGPSDPRWVGAWWLPFLIAGIITFIMVWPLAGYPRDIPGAAELRRTKVSEAHTVKKADDEVDDTGEELSVSCRDLPRYLKDLFTNPTYILLCVFTSFDSMLIAGFTSYGPKYVENQYNLPAGTAAMLFGLMSIPGGAGGTVIGGVVIQKLKLTSAGVMKWEIVLSLLVVVFCSVMFVICDDIPFAGVSIGYNKTELVESATQNMTAACNVGCHCDGIPFSPSCGVDGLIYYSPCHAGCLTQAPGDAKAYMDCACIHGVNTSAIAVRDGICSQDFCVAIPLFIVMFFFAMFFIFMCEGMNITPVVRCVPSSHRSFAIGIQWIILRLLGTIPGPLLFGAVLDNACSLWQYTNGVRGSCHLYDKEKLAIYLFVLCATVKIVASICVAFAWYFYKPPEDATLVDKKIEAVQESETTHM